MNKLVIGRIRTSHGVHGFLKVRSISGETGHFLSLKTVYLRKNGVEKSVGVSDVKPLSDELLIKFDGIDSPEEGRKYNGWEILVERESANPLKKGEYYNSDLCKCEIVKEGKTLGRVKSVCEGGADPLLEVETGNGKYLVPFIDEFIGKVDLEKGTIELRDEWLLQ